MIVKTPPVSFAALRSSIIPRTMASVAASGSASAAKTSLRVRMTAEARRTLRIKRLAAVVKDRAHETRHGDVLRYVTHVHG